MQSVVTGKVGEGRVVNHKGFGGVRCGELLTNQTVRLLDALVEGVVSVPVIKLIGFIKGAERFIRISGKDEGVGGRVPYMWLYGMTVTWMIVTFMVMISVAMFVVVQNQVYSFGGVEHLDMRGIVHQTVHPGLFEADVTDAEVGFAVAKGYELLRNRVVCFRAGTFGDHADYRELVACNGFREIALRFECDGNDRLFLSTALGRSSGARCQ